MPMLHIPEYDPNPTEWKGDLPGNALGLEPSFPSAWTPANMSYVLTKLGGLFPCLSS